jgi:pimeloyl-ACP methyl ester carboxylesterase
MRNDLAQTSLRSSLVVATLAMTAIAAQATPSANGPGHAEINGLRMYYERHGCPGDLPLVLLHGGGSTLESTFGRILPILARNRCVIAVEEQAHGRSGDRDAPVRFETSADDVAALLAQLGYARADIFGFSNGASVGLQVAIRHPQRVRKLVFASSITKKAGAQDQLWKFIDAATFENMPQRLKDDFLRVNPDPRQLRNMHDKDAERMRHFQDVPDEELRKLRAAVLVLAGDRDIVKPEHAIELTHLVPGARLLILPGGHGDYLGEVTTPQPNPRYPALTAALVAEFLDAP